MEKIQKQRSTETINEDDCVEEYLNLCNKQPRKSFSCEIANGDEKWIHYDNPKCKKSLGADYIIAETNTSYATYLVGLEKRNVCGLLRPNKIIARKHYNDQLTHFHILSL